LSHRVKLIFFSFIRILRSYLKKKKRKNPVESFGSADGAVFDESSAMLLIFPLSMVLVYPFFACKDQIALT